MANGNFGGGDGSTANPYLVEDAQDLNAIRNEPRKHYLQTKDIDLGSWGNWIPIGGSSTSSSASGTSVGFSGSFNGNSFAIKNLNCHHPGKNHVGLFGQTSSIATISNCYVSGNVSGGDYIGGLVGNAYSGARMYNCYASCNVSGNSKVGGLTGYTSNSIMSNCYSSGNVSGDNHVGGLSGSSFSATISNCYASGNVSGNSSTGGLVGNPSNCTISNCYALMNYIYRKRGSSSTTFYDIAKDGVSNCYSLNTLEFRDE